MINKDTLVKVVNKYSGTVGYKVPDLGVQRDFYPGEKKDITYDELEKLSFAPGGKAILSDYLEISDQSIYAQLMGVSPEPEYSYSREDIKKLMETGTLDQFLDCLDFAPASIKELIKDMAVELPLNDVAKRKAVQEKLGFDVTKAIEIKETKFDGGDAADSDQPKTTATRRVAINNTTPAPTGRRYQPAAKG